MRGRITKRAVDALRPGSTLADDEIKGFVARRLPSGAVSYALRYRDPVGGGRRWLALGLHGRITPDEARRLAKARAGDVAERRDPAREREANKAARTTVNALLDAFLARHAAGLRSGAEVARTFERLVRPAIGSIPIYQLDRRAIVEMLDAIEDGQGPVMADKTLAHVRKAFNWWAARDDRFTPPIVRGMARTRPAERARQRVLDDQEIRDVWAALTGFDKPPVFARLVRSLLLTGQRRDEVSQMRWQEIDGAAWTIPGERYKTGLPTVVPLTAAVLDQLGPARRSGFVLTTTNGDRPFSGFSKAKAELDARIAAICRRERRMPMPNWRLHDLRRTARSLMSRAGVPSDIAERVLGHKIPGVRGVYDRHAYLAERRDALERLANIVACILQPAEGNVVPIQARTMRG